MITPNDLWDLLNEICDDKMDHAHWGCGPDNYDNPYDFEIFYYINSVANIGATGSSRFLWSSLSGKSRDQVIDILRDTMCVARLNAFMNKVGLPLPGWPSDGLAKEIAPRVCPCGIDSRDCAYHG